MTLTINTAAYRRGFREDPADDQPGEWRFSLEGKNHRQTIYPPLEKPPMAGTYGAAKDALNEWLDTQDRNQITQVFLTQGSRALRTEDFNSNSHSNPVGVLAGRDREVRGLPSVTSAPRPVTKPVTKLAAAPKAAKNEVSPVKTQVERQMEEQHRLIGELMACLAEVGNLAFSGTTITSGSPEEGIKDRMTLALARARNHYMPLATGEPLESGQYKPSILVASQELFNTLEGLFNSRRSNFSLREALSKEFWRELEVLLEKARGY